MKLQPRHMKIAALVISALFLLLLVTSCIRQPTYGPTVIPSAAGPAVVGGYAAPAAPMVAAAPAPVIVNQAPAHSSFGDAFTGSMLGSMVGNMMGRGGPGVGGGDSTTVHKHVTINKTYVQQPTTTAPAHAPQVTPHAAPKPPAYTPPPPRVFSAPAPTPAPTRTFSAPSFSRPSFSAPRRR